MTSDDPPNILGVAMGDWRREHLEDDPRSVRSGTANGVYVAHLRFDDGGSAICVRWGDAHGAWSGVHDGDEAALSAMRRKLAAIGRRVFGEDTTRPTE